MQPEGTHGSIWVSTLRATLAVWNNEAESSHHFGADDRPAWIRPDGSGVLVREGRAWPFLLEYDRGTLDAGNFRAKFFGYRQYYEFELWRRSFAVEPALLFVCSDDRAERRVARAFRADAPRLPALLTTEWRYERDDRNSAGLLGGIWRALGSRDGTRDPWPRSIHLPPQKRHNVTARWRSRRSKSVRVDGALVG